MQSHLRLKHNRLSWKCFKQTENVVSAFKLHYYFLEGILNDRCRELQRLIKVDA